MYVNVALRDPLKAQDPNTYASGGPTWNVLDIWKAAAPDVFLAAPDIYDSEYERVTAHIARYRRPDNALLDVEIGNKPLFARYFFAILGNQGLGFAPFGMDYTGYANFPLGAGSTDDAAIAPFAENYALMAPWQRSWARLSFENDVFGVAEPDDGRPQAIDLGRWTATVTYGQPQFGPTKPFVLKNAEDARGGVLIAKLDPDTFILAGRDARVELALTAKTPNLHGMFLRVEEGQFDGGRWVFERMWNGDQTDWGLNLRASPQVLKVSMATY
jgi:hypothetical protein